MKLTITERTVYEKMISEKLEDCKNTNVNITPGVSVVYTLEIPEPLKAATRRHK